MANVSFHQLLAAPTVTRAISTIQTPKSRFQQFWDCLPGGAAVDQVGGHHAGWDIIDKTRSIAKGRPPGTGPSTVAPQSLGHVASAIYRSHEKIFLLEERIFRTRPLGANWGTVDVRGQSYVTKQEEFLAQRFKNSREFMLSRMMRGGFDLLISGDDMIPVDIGSGNFTVSYNMPAGNQNQLNMLGAGNIITTSWANAAADVIGNLMAINRANEQLHGRPLRHAWCNSTMISNLLVNTGLINAGGTANTVFQYFTPDGVVGPDGIPDTGLEIVFRGVPWVTFHAYDAGLDVNGTFTKFIPDKNVIFTPDPGRDLVEMYEGSEIVAENVLAAGEERYGLYAWTERKTQPAGWELIAVDNCLPALYLPKAIQFAQPVFP